MKISVVEITTQNLVPGGTATDGSAAELPGLINEGEVAIQVTGTYTGALTPQGTVDGANWVNLAGVTNASTGETSATIPSGAVGIYRCDTSGLAGYRTSANGAVTGAAKVTTKSITGPASGGGSSGPATSVGVPAAKAAPVLTNVADSATSVTIEAANSLRHQLIIVNDSTALMRIKYGSGASATSYTWPPLAQWDHVVIDGDDYTGIVTAIWDTAPGGFARVTSISRV